MSIPVHPERVVDEPDTLRWVMPAGTLTFVGAPSAMPAALQTLFDDATLATVLVEPDAVRLTITTGRSWSTDGARVRTALAAALAVPGDWLAPTGAGTDDVLRMAVEQVIAGDVGDYVRGHGGRISLVGVSDGRVEVALGGACSHCPASELTLTDRFEVAVRARCPDVREIVTRDEPGLPGQGGAAGGRRLLGLRPTRRARA